jgi:hypothetical protein
MAFLLKLETRDGLPGPLRSAGRREPFSPSHRGDPPRALKESNGAAGRCGSRGDRHAPSVPTTTQNGA